MIPKIIHQTWEGRKEPLPDFQKQLGETWKQHHPAWQYEFWDGDRMEALVNNNYPRLKDVCLNFPYDVQRWDFLRYLILYKMGGMYVDFDYECLASFDNYISENKCCFAMEPEEHRRAFQKETLFNNALMIAPPGHPFFETIITHIQTTPITYTGKKMYDLLVLSGPMMLTNLYETCKDKNAICFLPAELVSPWSKNEVQRLINKTADMEELEMKLEKAIAIHYFFGTWM